MFPGLSATATRSPPRKAAGAAKEGEWGDAEGNQ